MIKRFEIRKDGIGFCYEGSWINLTVTDEGIIVAEEISYEVPIGSQLSKIKLVIKKGTVYVQTPFGVSELKDSGTIIENIKRINEEVIKNKNKELYEKILSHLG
ncbi:hypothetical protein DDW09_04220 [Sulfolobus sp. SCGC AB-777_L09]|jgi:hypothetical protein|nr:hypothetical protein DDW09_04220 [Sulfolobus sp. SCGC AB-777_L09]